MFYGEEMIEQIKHETPKASEGEKMKKREWRGKPYAGRPVKKEKNKKWTDSKFKQIKGRE